MQGDDWACPNRGGYAENRFKKGDAKIKMETRQMSKRQLLEEERATASQCRWGERLYRRWPPPGPWEGERCRRGSCGRRVHRPPYGSGPVAAPANQTRLLAPSQVLSSLCHTPSHQPTFAVQPIQLLDTVTAAGALCQAGELLHGDVCIEIIVMASRSAQIDITSAVTRVDR